MRIILLQHVPKLGKKFDVKEVSQGYARNFLIPRKLATKATAQELSQITERKNAMKEQEKRDLESARQTAEKLEGQTITISAKVGEKGQMFSAIGQNHIAEQLRQAGHQVKDDQVIVEEKIQSAGSYPFRVQFQDDLVARMNVTIKPETE